MECKKDLDCYFKNGYNLVKYSDEESNKNETSEEE